MIRKNIISKYYILFFILLLFLFIVEGFFCNYDLSKFKKTYNFCEINFFKNFWLESGIVENIQSLFIFFSICFLIKAKFFYKNIKIVNYFLVIKIFALFYYLGEEISWGQHFINWQSFEFFVENNLQKETNIHNISNIFDQLPRTLVLIWCIFTVPILLMINKYNGFNKNYLLILCPDKNLIFISLLLVVFVFPEMAINKFNLLPSFLTYTSDGLTHPWSNTEQTILMIVKLNFIRLSELQEYIFTCYFLFYSMAISKKFKS
jgi:hypothetical protein